MKKLSCMILGLVAVLAAPAVGRANPASPFQVIVHNDVGGTAISRATLAAIFLGKVDRWGSGGQIAPVDLTATSSVREAFSEHVLGMPTAGVRHYWLERIAEGHWPPRTRQTDEEVVDYVASTPGAVGYVAPGTTLPDTVRVVSLK